ncbi:MAG: carbohydrate ABC transporter permease [Clostridiales bacterium]|jgi:multiple sugar transport system permease protein|nr:carbohydrate ABC transporter permease [Clostridiales bacterium]
MKFQQKSAAAAPALLLLLGLLFLAPLIVTFTNSFMTEGEIALNYTSRLTLFDLLDGVKEKFQTISLIPREAGLWQYADALINQPSFLILLTNSVKLTVPVLCGNLLVSLLTAYGFTICTWRFKEALFSLYVIVMLMPLQAVLVPNYIIADALGIKSGYLAIILPGIFSPFGVFLMRQGMKALPAVYFEAARMDGAGDFYIFRRIVVPQMKSAIAALLMLTFIEYWNLVEQAIIFISDYTKEPLSVYLSRIAEGRVGLVFAASCVYMFPPFWFLTVGQKDLEKGIELSGVK